LVFETDQDLTPGDIGIAFGNDAFDPTTGLDRNLLVDRIIVDGVTVQTEDPSTFSTGIYRDGLTGGGFFETELFNINAIFTFADVEQADRMGKRLRRKSATDLTLFRPLSYNFDVVVVKGQAKE